MAAGGVGLLMSLFAVWSDPRSFLVLFGALERYGGLRLTGWELLAWGDAVLAAFAAALAAAALVAARRRLPRAAIAGAGALCALSVVIILVEGFDEQVRKIPTGVARLDAALGPYLAFAALAVGLAGLALAWRRPRA
jgi:hypothetical protein